MSKSQGNNRHTLEYLPGVKVVKISMLKTDPDGKMLRESKLSKFQGKIRDTEEICGNQSCQVSSRLKKLDAYFFHLIFVGSRALAMVVLPNSLSYYLEDRMKY